jgi:dTMP kinase
MRLFVIEGIDGAGKSTQIKLLGDFLTGMGHKCKYMHFPRTEAPYFGELIARFLRGEFGSINNVDPYLVAMLYAGDRRDASDIIRAWLEEGRTVLLDRFTYSNIAYQCAKIRDAASQERLMNWILGLEFEHFAIPKPDINIFLDVPLDFTHKKLSGPRTGSDRKYLNGSSDIHEGSLEFQKKVRDIYLKVSLSDERLVVVNCSSSDDKMLPPDKIFDITVGLLKKRKLI